MAAETPPPTVRPRAPKGWRDWVLRGGFVAVLALGVMAMARATDWAEVWVEVQTLSVSAIVGLLGLSLVNYFLRAVRWHLFAQRGEVPSPLSRNLVHYLGGLSMAVTPGRVGELIRMRWLFVETGHSFARTAPLALMDRAADLASMALILALGLVMTAGGVAFGLPFAGLALAIAFFPTQPRLLSFAITTAYRTTGLLPRLMAKVRRAARSLRAFMTPGVLIPALTLSFFGWLAEGYAFYLLLDWMGYGLSFWLAVTIFTFATLAGGLTGAPGGLGGAEATMIALLTLEGVPLEVSIPATLLIRLTTLWFAIGVGLVAFPFAEKRTMR